MVLFGAAALAALLTPAASLQALRDDPTRVSAASFIQLFGSRSLRPLHRAQLGLTPGVCPPLAPSAPSCPA